MLMKTKSRDEEIKKLEEAIRNRAASMVAKYPVKRVGLFVEPFASKETL